MACGGLRGGVIIIGIITMVISVLGMGVVTLATYSLTRMVIVGPPQDQAQPQLPPPPVAAAEAARAPKQPVQGELSHLSDEQLAAWFELIDGPQSPVNDQESQKNQAMKTDASGQDNHQNAKTERNNSQLSITENTRNESTNERYEVDLGSFKDDRLPQTSETHRNNRESERGYNSVAFSTDSPITPQPSLTGASKQNPSYEKMEPLVLAPHRGDSFSERRPADESRGRRDTLSCGGPELERLLETVSSMSAQQTAGQTMAVAARAQGFASLLSAWMGLVLAVLLLCGALNTLSFGSGVLLIVGVVKERPGLLRPWRHLTLVGCALTVGLQVMVLGASLALNALGEEVARRNNEANAISNALCVVGLCLAGYFYWVVFSYERQMMNEQEEKCQNDNAEEKQSQTIYRF